MFKSHRRKEKKLQNQFLPEALELVEKPASPIGRFTIWIVTILLLAIVFWSIVGRVDETATAKGKIVTSDGLQEIQASKSGSVVKINISEGSHVKEGEILYVLDDTIEQANYEYLIENREQILFTIELLDLLSKGENIEEYELADLDQEQKSILTKYKATVAEYKNNEVVYYNAIETVKQELQVTMNEVEKLTNELKVKEDEKTKVLEFYENESEEQKQLSSIAKKIEFTSQEVEDYKILYDCGAIAKAELEKKLQELESLNDSYDIQEQRVKQEKFTQDNALLNINYEINDLKKQIDIYKISVTTKELLIEQEEAKKLTMQENYKKIMQNDLIEKKNEFSKNELMIIESEKQKNDMFIKAPCDGLVFQMKVKTVGGVFLAGDTIISIVPDSSSVQMEAFVLNRDIGNVYVNQEVFIKLDSYNYQKYGRVKGVISYIGPDAMVDDKLGLVYKVKIEIDDDSYNHSIDLMNGLSGTVEIKLGERRIIEFFLEPIIDMFDESLKVS